MNAPSEAVRPALPRLLLIADRFASDASVPEAVLAAVSGGVAWVQLRDHEADDRTFAEATERLVGRLRDHPDPPLIQINTRAEVAERLGVGLHVGWRGPSVAVARPRFDLLTAAVHTVEAARAAGAADALLFSPVYPTISKPGQRAAGLDGLRRVIEAVDTPVLALGGISPARAVACRAAGACGVAVLSAILRAERPEVAARTFINVLHPDA